jgi:predicted nucleotide-binding protein (sugar kinase/HSP70/actin superfamily)
MFSLTGDDSYKGMGADFKKKAWWSIVTSDAMEDIRSMILANASDPVRGMEVFEEQWEKTLTVLKVGDFAVLAKQLAETASRLSRLPMKRPPNEVPIVALVGEIYVRRDALSRQYLTERLAEKGFAVRCAPIGEWLHYTDYLVEEGHYDNRLSPMEKIMFFLKKKFMAGYEKRIKTILSGSGLMRSESAHVRSIIEHATPHLSANLYGEAVLTVGSALEEIVTPACGVISIGPFGCMPNRLSESILSEAMNRQGKIAAEPKNHRLLSILEGIEDLPFLAVESDGSPFPQLIQANLETFCLRAGRLHERIMAYY